MRWRRWLWVCLWPMPASAAELVLPSSEAAADWTDAIELSGLETAPGRALLTPGPPWRLTVQREDGTRVAHEVAPPTTPEAREAIAILATSLLQPVRLDTALPALPPPEAPPEPPPEPVVKPTPPPARPPPPEPVAPQPPPPEALAPPPPPVEPVAPPPPELSATVAVGPAVSQSSDQGTGLGGALQLTLAREGPFFAELGGRWLSISELNPDRPGRQLRDTSLWIGVGYRFSERAPAPRLALGGAGRRYRFEGSPVADVDVPWMELGIHYDLGSSPIGARLTLTARRDLRRVVLSNINELEGPISPWAVGISVALRRGRIGSAAESR